MRPVLVAFFLMFASSRAFAIIGCASWPTNTNLSAGKAGEIRMTTPSGNNTFNKIMYCDGGTWRDLGGSATATACTKNGEITVSGGELRYCNNGYIWRFDSGVTTNGACSKTGEMRWSSSQLQFCNGTNWRVVSTDTDPDPITGASLTNQGIESVPVQFFAVTGTTSSTANVTFKTGGGTCTNMSAQVCSDNASCTNHLGRITGSSTLTVPNASYLRLASWTSSQASTSCGFDVTIGSQSFSFDFVTTASDTSPTFTGPAEKVSQTPSSVVTSSIQKVYGHTGVNISISDAGTGGSPEFRVCSDSTCTVEAVTWGTATQTLTNPQWVQFRTTTGPTALDLKAVTITIGTGTYYWYVSTATCSSDPAIASGATLTCTCPANAQLYPVNPRGNINYRQGAPTFCKSAVHDGTITTAGGSVTAKGLTAGSPPGTCPSFSATTRNGVTSAGSGTAGASYYFPSTGTDACH